MSLTYSHLQRKLIHYLSFDRYWIKLDSDYLEKYLSHQFYTAFLFYLLQYFSVICKLKNAADQRTKLRFDDSAGNTLTSCIFWNDSLSNSILTRQHFWHLIPFLKHSDSCHVPTSTLSTGNTFTSL